MTRRESLLLEFLWFPPRMEGIKLGMDHEFHCSFLVVSRRGVSILPRALEEVTEYPVTSDLIDRHGSGDLLQVLFRELHPQGSDVALEILYLRRTCEETRA